MTPKRPSHSHAVAISWRRRTYEILEVGGDDDRMSRAVDTFLVTLILLNVASFVAETVPWIEATYGLWFHAFDWFSVIVFTIEYVLRLWTAVEVPFLSKMPPWRARLQMAARLPMIIDALAIVPFYLSYFFHLDLRVLRVLRLLRFLKLWRYSPAMHALIRVFSVERRSLSGALLLLTTALLFASTGMYYLEGNVQPDKFGSVPDAAWWAIATLTTVGYGDVVPVTPAGKLFGGLIMVMGLCILALPVAIISAGFAQEVTRRDFVINWSLMSRIPMLAELDAKEVSRIMPLLHAHTFPPDVEILPAGSNGTSMYFIASGVVSMQASDQRRSFGTGECFGEVAMLDHSQHTGTFVSAAPCRLLKLRGADFHRLEHINPGLAAKIREIAAVRRQERQDLGLIAG